MSVKSQKVHLVALAVLLVFAAVALVATFAPAPAYAACIDGQQRWVTTGTCCFLGSGVFSKLKLQWCDRGVWTSTTTYKCSGGCPR